MTGTRSARGRWRSAWAHMAALSGLLAVLATGSATGGTKAETERLELRHGWQLQWDRTPHGRGLVLEAPTVARISDHPSLRWDEQGTLDLWLRMSEPAAGRLVDTLQQRYGLNATLELRLARDSNPGPRPLRRLVYDAVRELMFNVLKHAQTDQAWVRICCAAGPACSVEVDSEPGRGTRIALTVPVKGTVPPR